MMGNPFAAPTLEQAPAAPTNTPSPSDQLVAAARDAAMQRAQLGVGLNSSFLTGPLGDTSAAPTAPAAALKGK